MTVDLASICKYLLHENRTSKRSDWSLRHPEFRLKYERLKNELTGIIPSEAHDAGLSMSPATSSTDPLQKA